MKCKYYILIVMLWTLGSCSKYEFVRSGQNPEPFTKALAIEDLVYLKEKSEKESFPVGLYIEATVCGIFGDMLYLSDNSAYALHGQVDDLSTLKVGDLVRISVGENSLNTGGQSYRLQNEISAEYVGTGLIAQTMASLSDVLADPMSYSSKRVGIESLEGITLKEDKDNGRYYSFESGGKQALLFVPNALNYEAPETLVSIFGFLRFDQGTAVFHINEVADMKEVYVEPMMIEKIMNNSTLVKALLQNSEVELTAGVKFAQFSYTNSSNLLTSASVFEVDLSNPNVKIEPGTPNNGVPPITVLQPLATMAQHKNAYYQDSWRVLAAISGDFYVSNTNPTTYILNGPMVRNGEILKSDFIGTTDNFLGVLKDGEGFVVGGRQEFNTIKDRLDQAVGGRIILKDGNIVEIPAIREPRPAIGFTKNNKVYLFVGNGRMLSVSNGYSPLEIAELMKALGCDGAVYMNGGGATVGVRETEGGVYEKFSQSHATNATHNPSLASAWMIVTKR
ncbi:phosphodiester glycosidase family protein [Sphingobacterium paucimobilis]|nr:phosphodiester glycosidase family protein [Sphingobacterium paucimobilis]